MYNFPILMHITLYVVIVMSSKERHKPMSKIINGTNAQISRFPHAAEFYYGCVGEEPDVSFYCGSVILNERVLITAAHCVYDCEEMIEPVVQVGSAYLYHGVTYDVDEYKVHEDYESDTLYNDICLLRTMEEIKFGPRVKRALLTHSMNAYKKGTIAGWGALKYGEVVISSRLKYIVEDLTSRKGCQKMLGVKLPLHTFCGGKLHSKSFTAVGDSGNGMMVSDYILIGILSFSYNLISPSVTVYENVCDYYSWIQDASYKLVCCKHPGCKEKN